MNKATKIIIVLVVLAVAVVVLSMWQSDRTSSSASNSTSTTGSTDTPGNTEPTRRLPTLVDLGATDCPACEAMEPIIDSIARDFAGQLEVQKINVVEDPEAGRLFKVRATPTLVFLDAQGKELTRHQGYLMREWIMGTWSELGYDFKRPAEGN